jgi:hypothetical protein
VVAGREPQRDGRGAASSGDQRGERRWDQRGDQRWAQVPRVDSNRIPDRRDGGRDDRAPRRDDDRYRSGDRGTWRDDRGRNWAHERGWYDRYRVDHFRYDRGQYRARQRYSIGYYNYPRGYSSRVWLRGQWLPFALYVNSAYYLDSYWQFDLYDPPYRARWIRVGSDALLVDIDSGEILDVIYELYW